MTHPSSSPASTAPRVEEEGTHCIFENRWWLEAVHNGDLRIIELQDDKGVSARMALPLSKKWGLVSARQPDLTQTLGPWVRTVSDNHWKQLAFEKEAMGELIAQMPRVDFHSLNFHHSRTNWLPFHWAGFNGALRLTYVLDDLSDIDKVWKGFEGSVRTDVKKAQRSVKCEVSEDLDEFLAVYHKTFARQGLAPPQPDVVVRRLDAACAQRGCRRILLARDEAGQVHAGAYIVFDTRAAYYLMGGADPALRKSGASTLLLWESISFAATVSRTFDFEGSMGEAIERYFRSFGGRQATFFNVRRARPLVRASLLAKEGLSLVRGR